MSRERSLVLGPVLLLGPGLEMLLGLVPGKLSPLLKLEILCAGWDLAAEWWIPEVRKDCIAGTDQVQWHHDVGLLSWDCMRFRELLMPRMRSLLPGLDMYVGSGSAGS